MKIKMLVSVLLLACWAFGQPIIGGTNDGKVFHGVSMVVGSGGIPLLKNNSNQTLIGFAIQEDKGIDAMLDLNRIAYGNPVKAGERVYMPGMAIFGGGRGPVIAVLFGDGTFYGPEEVYRDFAHRVQSIRSMARDIQYSEDRFATLDLHAAATPEAEYARRRGRPVAESVDFKALQHRSILAQRLADRRNYEPDESVSATIDSIAALPDVVKGDQQ